MSDFYRFYIFRASIFEFYFFKNKSFQQFYKNYTDPNSLFRHLNTNSIKTEEFYNEAKRIIDSEEYLSNLKKENLDNSLQGYFVDFRQIDLQAGNNTFYKTQAISKSLENIISIFSPNFLLNIHSVDANELNRDFYNELIHILGLKEFDNKGKILIVIDDTKKESFAKHILTKLQDKSNEMPELLTEITMGLLIVWLNRILFLKLIEANLIDFNDKSLAFLSFDRIKDFSTLSHLFFEVLAKKKEERNLNKGFNNLPYLNSSLFTQTELENKYLEINSLDNTLEVEYFTHTRIYTKDKRHQGKVRFLQYLFEFLSIWDFGKIKGQDRTKLINSAVLGLVFEKLNAYKEGSFYTPSFITMHMCKVSLERIVCKKFNTQFQWNAKNLQELRENFIDRDFSQDKKILYKEVLKSIRICDPSVGSGHFLVSALNDLIYIYYKLGLHDFTCELKIDNDELIIINKNGELSFVLPKQISYNNIFLKDKK
ncbi:hypothetical protein CCZ01_06095 [Helicobacter monodelphidis]|uniref:type IIG restriction enzyme/methyltransferase n=1 Tax=Helicobacter sp. 15-1451 TaxID=2004995 RepID=UPI000DCDE6A9|nr:hypothetical protein [Helicobacter sp. 15-1451]RAX57406.1 hypothetical protein CCZ01_06095 [Helicobacter sp. 15-1451]